MAEKIVNHNSHLTSGRLLARNTLWNLVGNGAPMLVAVFSIPLLIRQMGNERFGVISMAWIVVGYFSLFDLGIGRALTKLVADKLGVGEEEDIPALAWTALVMMMLLGVAGGIVAASISPLLVHRIFKVPLELQPETLKSFFLLSLSIPLVTLTSGFRGILEAKQRFRVLNLIRIPMSMFSFGGPLLVMPFSHSLFPLIGVLVGGRLIACFIHQYFCFHAVPALWQRVVVDRSLIPSLLKFGGWMMISNIVGPIIFYVDRFFIGAVLSLSAVSYYTVPFDLVNRFMLVPAAISGVLFPAFAMSMASDPSRTGLLLNRGVKYVFLTIFPLSIVLVFLGPEILKIWLGASFAEHSGFALQSLAVGMLLNSIAVIPFALLEGIGHPDLTGKLLLFEMIAYSVIAWLVIKHFGINGAAMAWVGRAAFEVVIFLVFSYQFLPSGIVSWKALASGGLSIFVLLYAPSRCPGLFSRVLVLIVLLLFFCYISWRWLLNREEKIFVAQRRLKSAVGEPVAIG
jgi:O-antigen/teichoic acid export membrane protein